MSLPKLDWLSSLSASSNESSLKMKNSLGLNTEIHCCIGPSSSKSIQLETSSSIKLGNLKFTAQLTMTCGHYKIFRPFQISFGAELTAEVSFDIHFHHPNIYTVKEHIHGVRNVILRHGPGYHDQNDETLTSILPNQKSSKEYPQEGLQFFYSRYPLSR